MHAELLARRLPSATLAAVFDARAESATAIGAELDVPVTGSVAEMLAAPDIDAVAICTSTDTHADLIVEAARAGKAIFCEKPIDLDLGRVKTCLAIVKQEKATLMVGFNRRFDPHFQAVRKAIDDGMVGKVEMVQIVSRDPGAPPAEYITRSGGIFKDMTIHDFDMARFLLGEDAATVTAQASVLVDKKIGKLGDYDSVSVMITTAGGRHCTISNSRRATYGYDQRIEVHGSKGRVAAENQRPVPIDIANGNGYTRPPLHDFFMTRYLDAYANEIAAFIETMTAGRKASPSGADGLAALRLADAALKSVRKGKTIRLDKAD